MGATYIFDCEKCGYQAKVAGGLSEGLEVVVQTILCTECRQLHDAVVSVQVPLLETLGEGAFDHAPEFAEVAKRLPYTGAADRQWKEFHVACPVDEEHPIRSWKLPDKCPRCDVFMERSAIPFQRWD